ncbi:hypothetical protein lerEdw1_020650, partial [Lerista edwardsae]
SALVFLGGESVPALKSRAVGNRHRPQLWDFARALTELQESEAELSEEHSTALKEWEEQRASLERELHSALAEKKCLEEKIEILQGTISLLEDQLMKLKDNSSLPEKGEVMGDVLKVGAGPRWASEQGITLSRWETLQHFSVLEATFHPVIFW